MADSPSSVLVAGRLVFNRLGSMRLIFSLVFVSAKRVLGTACSLPAFDIIAASLVNEYE